VTSFDAIAGQQGALHALRQALDREQLGAAYLFVGPSGVGKYLAAMALTRAAICPEQPGQGCGSCETCRRVDQGVHPDVRVFAPRSEGNRNIPVEYLRNEILPLTKFAPFEAKAAFLIFPQADVSFPVLHPEAANALLKTLEEPRAGVHFILLSERPDRLLPTIRSRCQRVRFAPLKRDVLDAILERHGIAAEQREQVLMLCGGRADRALQLCDGERASRVLDFARRVDAALQAGDPAELLELGDQIASDEDRALVLDSLAAHYRDRAVEALGLADLGTPGSRLTALAAAQRVARFQLLAEDLERNANPQLALEGLLFELRASG
jgi:DNA polymerase III subunit delta'